MFDSFSALGDIAFAFAGHSVALEIQATIPSTPGKPSKKPMWKGVVVAYLVVAVCYLPVSFVGYWVFGNKVEDNILLSLEKPRWLVAVANLFVVIHVIGSYQVCLNNLTPFPFLFSRLISEAACYKFIPKIDYYSSICIDSLILSLATLIMGAIVLRTTGFCNAGV